jgi:dolichol-phosphate mannosyltransferase
MLELIQRGRDVVVASRFPDGAVMVGVPRLRRAIGWAGSLLLQALFPIQGLREYTCGFRAYRACVLQRAFGRYGDGFISESGFTCMVDILLKLRLDSLLMGEVPLVLRYDRKSSKSKMRVSETIRQTLWLAVRRRFGWT